MSRDWSEIAGRQRGERLARAEAWRDSLGYGPCRMAVERAQRAVIVARAAEQAAEDAWQKTEAGSAEEQIACVVSDAGTETREACEAALVRALDAVAVSDEPSVYTLRDADSGVTEERVCTSDEQAKRAAQEWAREGDYGEQDGTCWTDVFVTREDGHDLGRVTVQIEPDEPACEGQVTTIQYRPRLGGLEYPGCSREEATYRGPDQVREADDAIERLIASDPEWAEAGLRAVTTLTEEHDWQDDGAPGFGAVLTGHGGGVICRERCAHCGLTRVTDTWAQRHDTGEQGLTSVSYEREAS